MLAPSGHCHLIISINLLLLHILMLVKVLVHLFDQVNTLSRSVDTSRMLTSLSNIWSLRPDLIFSLPQTWVAEGPITHINLVPYKRSNKYLGIE